MKAKSAKGFFLLEIMIGIVVVMIATSVGYQYYDNYLTEQVNQVTAQQHKQVIKAAQTYIKSNYSTIAAQSMPYTISMATLQSSGLLPSSLSKNPFGQSYSVVVRNPGSGLMALVITTGGQVIEEGSLPRIARLVGAEGGYISTTNAAIANGAFKAWNETLSNYGVAPGAGHLAGSIFFNNASIASDFLYRSAVSGMPALNTMNTNLNMGGNDITGADTIIATSVTATSGLAGATASITGALTAGSVTTNSLTVNGSSTVTGASTVNGAFVGGSVKSNTDLTATTDVVAGRYLQLNTTVTEGAACSTSGQVAKDSSGAILSCQSGSWHRQGATYNADISPDYGVVDLAGGLKMTWQRFVIVSCVDYFKWTDGGYTASCTHRFNFKYPFPTAVYYVSAIGQDTAEGATFAGNGEGSEMSFGILQQDRWGVNMRINRVYGSNGPYAGSFAETMGVTIYSIGL